MKLLRVSIISLLVILFLLGIIITTLYYQEPKRESSSLSLFCVSWQTAWALAISRSRSLVLMRGYLCLLEGISKQTILILVRARAPPNRDLKDRDYLENSLRW